MLADEEALGSADVKQLRRVREGLVPQDLERRPAPPQRVSYKNDEYEDALMGASSMAAHGEPLSLLGYTAQTSTCRQGSTEAGFIAGPRLVWTDHAPHRRLQLQS